MCEVGAGDMPLYATRAFAKLRPITRSFDEISAAPA
jgi:hypothetical protein